MPGPANRLDNKCQNCLRVFQNIRLKRLPVCAHTVCSKCNPVLLRKQGKLKADQLCPVCAKKPPSNPASKPNPPKSKESPPEVVQIKSPREVEFNNQSKDDQDDSEEDTGADSQSETETDCAICTDELKNPITLPCEHRFCQECFDHWEERASTCPLCRVVVNEEKQRRIDEDRERRRRRRHARNARSVQPPFPDPLYNTRAASAIAASILLIPMIIMFICGNFAVKNCHAMMFIGFPFWTGIHMVIVVCLTLMSVGKSSSTVIVVQIVLVGFGIIFNTMSIFLGCFQLKFTMNSTKIARCDEFDPEPRVLIDIMLISAFVVADAILICMILISMVTLGANPAVCILKRYILPNSNATPHALLHYYPGSFFPHEGHFSTIGLHERVFNIMGFVLSGALLVLATLAFRFCHAFRATGIFIWCPVMELLFALFHLHTFGNPTWCRITTSMIISSFAALTAFIMACFGGGK